MMTEESKVLTLQVLRGFAEIQGPDGVARAVGQWDQIHIRVTVKTQLAPLWARFLPGLLRTDINFTTGFDH